jgi:hypothetical protein
MLPFLNPKSMPTVMIAARKPSGEIKDLHEEGEHDPGFMAAAEDLISAIHAKDAKGVAEALKSAFELSDAMPHVEGEHINEDE